MKDDSHSHVLRSWDHSNSRLDDRVSWRVTALAAVGERRWEMPARCGGKCSAMAAHRCTSQTDVEHEGRLVNMMYMRVSAMATDGPPGEAVRRRGLP